MYSNKLICDILFYIDKNINNKINIQDIADIFFFNRFYIMKLFKKELGISINNYINLKRILNSLSDIKNTDDSYLTIALNNGFNSCLNNGFCTFIAGEQSYVESCTF